MVKYQDDRRKLISELLIERKRYEKCFGIDGSRKVYNFLILHHIRGIKNNYPTLIY